MIAAGQRGLVFPILRVLAAYFGIFNVRWYGAKCDATIAGGGTDDTTAVQAAITAAAAVNGTVFFPAYCKTSSALTITSSVTLCGPGGAAFTGTGAVGYAPAGGIIYTQTNSDAITVTGNSSTRNVHIHDFAVIHPSYATYSSAFTAGAAIRCTNTISTFLERVTIFGCYDGIVFDGSGTTWAPSLKDIEVGFIKHDGISLSHGTTVGGIGHASIQDAQITNANLTVMTGAALRLNGVSGGSFENIDCIGAATGIHIGNTIQSIYLFFRNCLGDTCTLPWDLENCRVSEFDSCYAATIGGSYGVAMRTNAQDLNWRGGTFSYFTTGAFYLDACDNVNIQGANFASYSGTATASPFVFVGSTTRVSIKDSTCKATDFTGAGCALGASGHTELWIEGNRFNAAITGTRTGTGNRITLNRNDDI